MAAARHPAPADAPAPADDPRWAELADLTLVVAREIQVRGYADPEAVPLTQTEGTVMRHLNENDGAAPSVIAAATGLQRTNLATVLTGLQRKGLVERRQSAADGRAASIHTTEHGRANYALVQKEWGAAVHDAAADRAVGHLDAALALLREIRSGLVETRPATPGRPAALM
ncbi:MAG TPA: MarR family transcriptional regulator [Actinospica sp.]|jgi:DNA-binding MarR family transcriptional regulator|nr:MarR family transcriptional regulator [Actinospica sp.]